jgi:hypothetical protein
LRFGAFWKLGTWSFFGAWNLELGAWNLLFGAFLDLGI